MSADPVNHPSHYANGEIECIDALKEQLGDLGFHSYLHGNIAKYLWRWQKKEDPIQDLEKAEFYLKRLIAEAGGRSSA